jgi:hypothetical protein
MQPTSSNLFFNEEDRIVDEAGECVCSWVQWPGFQNEPVVCLRLLAATLVGLPARKEHNNEKRQWVANCAVEQDVSNGS